MTFEQQDLLPKLAIPEISSIESNLKEIFGPILNDYEYETTIKSLKLFFTQEGKVLLEKLKKKNENCENYVDKYWKNAYLSSRCSLMLNINPVFIFEDDPTPARSSQIARAASLLLSSFKFVSSLKTKMLSPDKWRDKPLCMAQYKNLFGSARIPNSCGVDEVITYEESRHIVVLYRNKFYSFDALDNNFCPYLTEREISKNLEKILKDQKTTGLEIEIGIFTALNRDEWSDYRIKLEVKNSEILKVIDSALFILCLDDFETNIGTPSETVSSALCGKIESREISSSRWYDKLQLIVSSTGQASVNFEHSIVDGHTVLRFVSDVYTDTIIRFAKTISGARVNNFFSNSNEITESSFNRRNARKITRLEFNISNNLKQQIKFAREQVADAANLLNVSTLEFSGFGSSFIKSFNMSPDGFVQVALMGAFYSLYGKSVNTYESVLTKRYKLGRTEASRNATMEALEFYKYFFQPDLITKEIKELTDEETENCLEKLHLAIKKHSTRIRNAAQGQGVDRVLFALKCLQEELGEEQSSFFKSKGYQKLCTSTLSTSNCGNPSLRFFGFGPVTPEGLGAGYVIKDDSLNFCVTGYEKRSKRFVEELNKYLNRIHDLIVSTDPKDFELEVEKITIQRQTSDVYDFYGETA